MQEKPTPQPASGPAPGPRSGRPSAPFGSSTWGFVAYLALSFLAGIGVYAAARLGTAELIASLLLPALAGVLAIWKYRQAARVRAEESDCASLAAQVEEAQVNYQSIFNNAVEGIFQSTPEGSFITANPALARMFGMETPEELISEMSGWPARHFFSDTVRWAEMIRFIEGQDSVAEFEAEVVRKDGRTIWISQNVHAIWGEEDELLYLEGTLFDITERYWAERRRTLQYATTKILNDSASVIEARPKILQTICELLEWDMGAVWDVVLPENVLRCVEIWHTQGIDIAEFEDASLEVTFAPGVRLAGKVWMSGEPSWVVNFASEEFSPNALVAARYGMNSVFGIPIKVGGEVMHVLEFFSPKASEPDPELLQMLGVVANQIGYLVERKLAEEALRDSVVRKAAILESALDSIITFDHEGKVSEWNPAAERTFGYRKAEVLGRPLAELILPERLRKTSSILIPHENASGLSLGRRSEIVAARSNGQEFAAEVAMARVQVHGRPLFTAYVRDITDVKRAERLRSELAAIVAASDDAIFSQTLDGIILSWNAGAERIFGYSAAEMINRPSSRLLPMEQMNEFVQGLTNLRRGRGVQNFEALRLRKDGRQICVSLTEAPIRNERGGVISIASTARDVTEYKRTGEQLLQSQKMEAVGRLAGSVAHDFNNILTAILGYSDLLLTQIPAGAPYHKSVAEIRKAGQFAASLTHQLLAFSRGQALELQVLDINGVVANLEPILRRLIDDKIHIVVVPSSEVSMVRGDPGQLEQVLLNLAVNAGDAMPSGGVITVHTSNVFISEENPGPGGAGMPTGGKWVKLLVRDTGAGMSETVKRHIFEPFFTTKDRGRGTGLGLATCYGIVKQSGGYISCESAPGQGTAFQIFLPLVEESSDGEAIAVENEFAGLDLPCGSETILLVEDEKSVRRLTVQILGRLGYTVLEAKNAREAQALVDRCPERKVDLLLSDIVLPDSSGKELAEWLLENSPGIRILFTSGYVEDAVFNNYGLSEETAFLQKPFTPASLAQKVREVLGERGN